MKFTQTPLAGVVLIEPNVFGDARIILSARADLEIEGCPDVLDSVAELLDLFLVGKLGGNRLAAEATSDGGGLASAVPTTVG